MESKKRRALFQDCQAVSEVIGQMLMVGIVIIAVSTIAMLVFSKCGIMKPAPCTYIQEKIDTKTHCIYITHSEGEAINLSAIKIILMFPDGHRDEFSKSKPVPFNFSEGSSGLEDNVFGVGDCIKINDVNITSGNDIEMFYVYTPSQLVIRHIVLHAPTDVTSSTNTTSTDTTSTGATSTDPTSTDATPSTEVNQKPVANFTSNVTEGYVPLYVQFTDHSENATGWSWDFEDGETSNERNPTHTYSKVGTHTVNQTTTNVIGTDSKLAIINVLKGTPTISWNTPTDIIYGTALSNVQLNAQANVLGNFVYTPAIGTVLNAGTQTLHVEFTPTDTTNYNTASKDVAINVNKANPLITWSNPADISDKTALSSTQLNAIVTVPGTFVYTPQSGTVLSAGVQTLHAVFTPTDITNYNTASADVQINVIAPPIADFTANPTSGKHPLDVQFTDKSNSTDAYYWYWNFGDQSTSTDQNPTHKYTKVGTYAVSLTVKDIFGTNTTTKTGYIIVSN